MASKIISQILWLIVCLTISIWSVGKFTEFNFGVFDIPFHDTYFVMDSLHLIIFIFLWITLIVFTFKELYFRFKRKFPLIILVSFNTLNLILTGMIISVLVEIGVETLMILEILFIINLILMISFEIFLFKRLIKLRRL